MCVPSQWSKGEYAGANNAEDDFAVLQSNGLSLRTDDYGNTLATATPLTGGTASGSVTTFSVRGVIASASDVDVLSIQPAAGPVTITLTGASRSTNLDAAISLLSASGAVLATANPTAALGASLTFSVPSAGTYYVRVQGTGNGDPLVTGYTSYGSVGNYALTVSVTTGTTAPGVPPVAAILATTATTGYAPLTVSFSAAGSTDSDGTIVSYSWTFGDGTPAGTGVTTSHTFTTVGTFSVTVRVTDNSGLSTTSSIVTVTTSTAPATPLHLSGFTLVTTITGSGASAKATAKASITVVNGSGLPVSGVSVTGSWSGLVTTTSTASTATNGVASFTSPSSKKRGTFTFTVTSVTKAGTVYVPSANTVVNTKSVTW
jgi:PKD repeat protein